MALTTGAELDGPVQLWYDTAKATMKVNGKAAENGCRLTQAGFYDVSLTNLENDQQTLTYKIKVKPNINVWTGRIFTEFPVITCTNVEKIEHRQDMHETEITSGDKLTQLGMHTVAVYFRDAEGKQVKDSYVFYVKAVHAERIYDAENGHALKVTVGSFEGLTVEAMLDEERPLNEGANIVKEIGTHTLHTKINGVAFTDQLALPDSNELSLRVEINFASMIQTAPFYFDFTGWNDNAILLDGRPVTKGEIRVDGFGKHTLEVRDKDGKPIENAFDIKVDDVKKGAMTKVEFQFQNPHFYIALGAIVLAVVAAIFAVILFVARRRLV